MDMHGLRAPLFAAAFVLGTAGAGLATPADCCLDKEATTPLKTEVIADGLDEPWAMAFLPDGSILVTEKPGAIRHIVAGEVSDPFEGLPEIEAINQGGLMDIALDPDFAENALIYFTYTEPSADGGDYGTAVARARLDLAGQKLEDVEVIFRASDKSSGGRHFGSRIRFNPDKTMFVTLGDRGTQMRAQDPFDHAGSVIRINRDGSVPADNPFADGAEALAEIWSIGHRNPQGAALHPQTGALWTLSHGAAGGDEINIAEAGLNYGWPLISYGSNYSGARFAKGIAAEGLEQPVYYWNPSIAPSGLTFYSHSAPLVPDWQGRLLAGALRAEHLSVLTLDGDSVVAEERYFADEFGRIRDVRTGPDGAVWLLTDSSDGELIRVTQTVD
ncbi:MAG: PQQ-dependent sugar dehydrogenase [Pseudomonadota bacterium]